MSHQQDDLAADFSYEGSELDLFSGASNWKNYWSSIIKPLLGPSVLEIGAGIGATAKLFANCKVEKWMAIEPDISLVNRIKQDCKQSKYPDNFEVHAATSGTLSGDYKFDTILYIDVLEHIQDDKSELNHIARLLKSGGRIIILSPAHEYLYTPFDRAIGHFRRYNRKTILAVKPEGLRVESVFYLDSLGMLASLGNRLLLKSEKPTEGQIQFWDKRLVPVSRIMDKLVLNSIGKSIIGVFQLDCKKQQ